MRLRQEIFEMIEMMILKKFDRTYIEMDRGRLTIGHLF
jgi:hypothetical protein